MNGNEQSWLRLALGYSLIAFSTVFWLLAPLPWWFHEWPIVSRALGGLTLIALAELSFHVGLWALGPAEAKQFYRWKRLKRGFRQLTH